MWWEYKNPLDFEKLVRRHLSKMLWNMHSRRNKISPLARAIRGEPDDE
jgi:hypothetical protein